LWGILGMILGAAVFAEFYPALKTTVYTWGNLGKITLPEVLGVSHWVVIPVFIVAGIVLFWWFEKKGL
ncbi:MAG TPA: YeeE/YedE family protein, partial [Syntrophales bacterium]|nr:YeeE/YedE family protein [Syntrophales bacterium]